MYNQVELFYAPQKIFDKLSKEAKDLAEMTSFQQAFLCGLIKEKKPRKIVEIGTSAGATTAVLLECVSELQMPASVYSIDCSKKWYRDANYPTGFVASEAEAVLKKSIRFNLLTGKYPVEYAKEIIADGELIDFLVLDTAHTMPGEILDFIAYFPYLSENAVVVLHDVAMNLIEKNSELAFATRILFSVVQAKKYYMLETQNLHDQNIAAFEITRDTKRSIQDIVSALSITWTYWFDDEVLEKYRAVIKENYEESVVLQFNEISKLQLVKAIEQQYRHDTKILIHKWKQEKQVLIYGMGYWGRRYQQFAQMYDLPIAGFLISDDQTIPERGKDTLPAWHISECPFEPEKIAVVIAVDLKTRTVMEKNAMRKGYCNILNL